MTPRGLFGGQASETGIGASEVPGAADAAATPSSAAQPAAACILLCIALLLNFCKAYRSASHASQCICTWLKSSVGKNSMDNTRAAVGQDSRMVSRGAGVSKKSMEVGGVVCERGVEEECVKLYN